MPTLAIDWDDTLVGYKKYGEPGEWLPEAAHTLRRLRNLGFSITIYSCRVNWGEGRQEIIDKLKSIKLEESSRLKIVEKPLAVAYIDDRAIEFKNDWPRIFSEVKKLGSLSPCGAQE